MKNISEINYIDGTTGIWRPHLQKRHDQQEANKSQGHLAARQLIKELYPTLQILEEVHIPITKSEYGFLDFYLPLLRLAVEVNGGQHYKFNAHFHKDHRDFLYQQRRDKNKREWCSINNIKLVELDSTKDSRLWKQQILCS